MKIPEPKVILWDIETTNLNANFGFVVCFGWKELGEEKAHVISITDFPSFGKDCTNDKEVVNRAAAVLSCADIWVTWYGQRFDEPFVNSRLLSHGLKRMPPIPHVDGWRIAREKLKLHSNRLASVCSFLGLEDKTPIKSQAWIRAMAGHRPSIKYVVDHCRQDVQVLEQAYLKIRPLSTTHPNLALITERPNSCPICGEWGKITAQGWKITRSNKARRYQCQKCGGWSLGPPVKVEGISIR